MMSAVLARILLRYGVGVFAALFFLSDEVAHRISADPEIVQLVSFVIAFVGTALTEGFYILAKRFGWST